VRSGSGGRAAAGPGSGGPTAPACAGEPTTTDASRMALVVAVGHGRHVPTSLTSPQLRARVPHLAACGRTSTSARTVRGCSRGPPTSVDLPHRLLPRTSVIGPQGQCPVPVTSSAGPCTVPCPAWASRQPRSQQCAPPRTAPGSPSGAPYGAHPAQRGLDNDTRWNDRGQPLEHGRRGGSTGRCGAEPADPAESSAHRPPGVVEPRSGWGLTPG
jgi:hypothetical protein